MADIVELNSVLSASLVEVNGIAISDIVLINGTGSWLSGWGNRIGFTIDSSLITDTLTDFPLALILSASAGIGDTDLTDFFDKLTTDANRKKIAVTDADGITQLPVEIDWFNVASEKAVLHTKVPSIPSSSDKTIYLYYDSTQSDNANVGDVGDAIAKTVWDDNFIIVLHCSDPEVIANSTGLLSAIYSTMQTDAVTTGILGSALKFNAVDTDYFSFTDNALLDSSVGKTIEMLFSVDNTFNISSGADLGIVTRYDASSPSNGEYLIRLESGTGKLLCGWYSGGWNDISSVQAEWVADTYYAVGVGDGSGGTDIIINGVSDNDDAVDRSNQENARALTVGAKAGLVDYFDGILDEFRLSKVVRSVAWMKATNHGLLDSLLTAAVS